MVSFEPLRNILKNRHISTYYLRNKCGSFNLDSETIQRFINDESISTYHLKALSKIMGCEPSDLMRFIPDSQEKDSENPEA